MKTHAHQSTQPNYQHCPQQLTRNENKATKEHDIPQRNTVDEKHKKQKTKTNTQPQPKKQFQEQRANTTYIQANITIGQLTTRQTAHKRIKITQQITTASKHRNVCKCVNVKFVSFVKGVCVCVCVCVRVCVCVCVS